MTELRKQFMSSPILKKKNSHKAVGSREVWQRLTVSRTSRIFVAKHKSLCSVESPATLPRAHAWKQSVRHIIIRRVCVAHGVYACEAYVCEAHRCEAHAREIQVRGTCEAQMSETHQCEARVREAHQCEARVCEAHQCEARVCECEARVCEAHQCETD